MMDIGTERLEEDTLMFFDGHREVYPLYEAFLARLLRQYPQTAIKVQKTQISFELPESYFVLTLGLPGPLRSERVAAKTEPYPGRWTTHIVVSRESDLDEELFGWVEQAHAFAACK